MIAFFVNIPHCTRQQTQGRARNCNRLYMNYALVNYVTVRRSEQGVILAGRGWIAARRILSDVAPNRKHFMIRARQTLAELELIRIHVDRPSRREVCSKPITKGCMEQGPSVLRCVSACWVSPCPAYSSHPRCTFSCRSSRGAAKGILILGLHKGGRGFRCCGIC